MNHLLEWEASGVDRQLTQLNVIPLEGQTPYNYLLYADDLPRRKDGRLRANIMQRYQHLKQGGWWCSGINPLTGEDEDWGCFKPAQPRYAEGKAIKYEHPPKTPTRLFALRVTQSIWQTIANRGNASLSAEEIQPERSDLGFWQWVKDNPSVPLCITEGAKKAGALLTAGYAAIALPGIHSGYRIPKNDQGRRISHPHLIPELQPFIAPNRPITIVFDQDSKPQTLRAVQSAIRRMGYLLQQAGCQVNIVTWNPQWGKGVDDLIASQGAAAFHQAYSQALPFDRWKATITQQLTHPRTLTLHERYFPATLPIPETAQLVAIKSAKGTGKTQLLETIVKQAKRTGQPVLVISHRVQLVESLAARFGLPALTGEASPDPGVVLCIDSLHPHSRAQLNPQDWQNALVVIDEIEQVLWHGLNSSTCRRHRVAILNTLKSLIQTVLGGTGQVWVADADLSDLSLEYLMALSGIDPDVAVVENTWKPSQEEAWQVYSYEEKTPERLVEDLAAHIASGGRPMVCLSAQKRGSKWGTITLESYLQQRFPERRFLRIDSETLADPTHPAYGCTGERFDRLLSQYDGVLASPAIETGVSIDLKGHFTSVWAIAQGIQAENSVRQALSRLRESVPRYVWIAPYGFNRVGNGSTSLASLLSCEHRLTQVNIRLLQQSDFTQLDGLDLGFQAESLMTWAKLAVRFNGGMARYREAAIGSLMAEGHVCQSAVEQKPAAEEESEPTLKTTIDRVLEQNYQAECEAIADSGVEQVSVSSPSTLYYRTSQTPDQRRRSRHQELWQKYGIPVTPELVSLDDRGWYEQLQYHYFLTVGRPYLADRDTAMARELLSRRSGGLFLPDFNSSQLGSKIGTMELLGIPSLIADPERVFMNTDVDLQQLQDIALSNREEVRSLFGIGLAKNASGIMILRRFINLLGYSLEHQRTTSLKGSGKRLRIYGLVCPDDPREQVFQQWLQRDQMDEKTYPRLPLTLPDITKIEDSGSDRYQQLSLFGLGNDIKSSPIQLL
ncbi:plasmid replication protein, CyRepA1 family [Roseofilum capinflatum]|uniref:DUF3854 domain-containing protein n=1 Tax=Roseofilum capinflatum BLCC-M114 TaxID=3022440 RepID=A0ABT7B6R2_9CYAN|nr:plasmid replication protein, CyRepA1 family [Roseofilum capinflatum]MDJ1174853.1 DUF3854 domain-containing protein [Roseofilum capinflatum BLCC-M114]